MKKLLVSMLVVLTCGWMGTGCVSPKVSAVRSETRESEEFHQIPDHSFALRVQAPDSATRQVIEDYTREALTGTTTLIADPDPPRFVDVTFLYDEFWEEDGWDTGLGGSVFGSNYGSGVGLSLNFSKRNQARQPTMVMALRGKDGERLWRGTAELGAEDIDRAHPEAMARTAIDLLVLALRRELGLEQSDEEPE